MGFFDKLFGGKSKDENTAKFTNQSKTVLTPLQGKVLDRVVSPCEGWLFTVREYTMVDQGSLMARMLREGGDRYEA